MIVRGKRRAMVMIVAHGKFKRKVTGGRKDFTWLGE
jgi:hypothetical protein